MIDGVINGVIDGVIDGWSAADINQPLTWVQLPTAWLTEHHYMMIRARDHHREFVPSTPVHVLLRIITET